MLFSVLCAAMKQIWSTDWILLVRYRTRHWIFPTEWSSSTSNCKCHRDQPSANKAWGRRNGAPTKTKWTIWKPKAPFYEPSWWRLCECSSRCMLILMNLYYFRNYLYKPLSLKFFRQLLNVLSLKQNILK